MSSLSWFGHRVALPVGRGVRWAGTISQLLVNGALPQPLKLTQPVPAPPKPRKPNKLLAQATRTSAGQ
jgi:hypothetical protein